MNSVRDRLVSAATELLDRGGPATVTLREVGRLAGVSHNAPYKHFADKEALLAAVAARELGRQHSSTSEQPEQSLRSIMTAYVDWAIRYPHRFKLTFGSWSTESFELAEAAAEARSTLVGVVEDAQRAGGVPQGDPERIAALLLAVAHGSVDLALNGHLARDGKGRAEPVDLVDDLLELLRASTPAVGQM